jgi:hypothetical protein
MPSVLTNKPVPARPVVTDVAKRRFFTYTVDFGSIASGTTVPKTLLINSNSDFEVIKLTQNSYVDTAGDEGTILYDDLLMGVHYPGLTVMITDTGTQKKFMDIATPLTSLFGTAQQPFVLPNTWVLKPNTALTIEVSNLYTANTIANVQLAFVGRKIFRG